jgi:hypothetical protein
MELNTSTIAFTNDELFGLWKKLGSCANVSEYLRSLDGSAGFRRITPNAVQQRLVRGGYGLAGIPRTKKCRRCKAEFQAKDNQVYCTQECRYDALVDRLRRKNRESHPLATLQCVNPDCPLPERKLFKGGYPIRSTAPEDAGSKHSTGCPDR